MLSEKTKNKVLSGGDFYRLYYSDEEASYNGLYVAFTLENTTVEKYFNKIKCCFNQKDNRHVIAAIKDIEKSILAQAPDARSTRCIGWKNSLTTIILSSSQRYTQTTGLPHGWNCCLRCQGYGRTRTSMVSPFDSSLSIGEEVCDDDVELRGTR